MTHPPWEGYRQRGTLMAHNVYPDPWEPLYVLSESKTCHGKIPSRYVAALTLGPLWDVQGLVAF